MTGKGSTRTDAGVTRRSSRGRASAGSPPAWRTPTRARPLRWSGDRQVGDHVPADRGYHPDHGWAQVDGDGRRSGSPGTPRTLGDVLSVWLPAVGSPLVAGEPYGEVESIKTLSDLVAPLAGEVVEVDAGLAASAGAAGQSRALRARVACPGAGAGPPGALIDADAYRTLVGPRRDGWSDTVEVTPERPDGLTGPAPAG